MEDKELLEKIIAKQSVIIPAMEKTGETKDIPEKLRHAMAAAEEWADVIEKKEGRRGPRAHRPVRSRDAPADPRVLRAGGPPPLR